MYCKTNIIHNMEEYYRIKHNDDMIVEVLYGLCHNYGIKDTPYNAMICLNRLEEKETDLAFLAIIKVIRHSLRTSLTQYTIDAIIMWCNIKELPLYIRHRPFSLGLKRDMLPMEDYDVCVEVKQIINCPLLHNALCSKALIILNGPFRGEVGFLIRSGLEQLSILLSKDAFVFSPAYDMWLGYGKKCTSKKSTLNPNATPFTPKMEWQSLDCYTYSGSSPLYSNGTSVSIKLDKCQHGGWSHICKFCLDEKELDDFISWVKTDFGNPVMTRTYINNLCRHKQHKGRCTTCREPCKHKLPLNRCKDCYSSIFDLYVEIKNKTMTKPSSEETAIDALVVDDFNIDYDALIGGYCSTPLF